jgi:hypothetical protein
MSTKFAVLLFTSYIYVLVLAGFNKARSKFAGDKTETLIGLVVLTVILLFLADYILLLEQYFTYNVIFIAQTLLKTAGLSCLAFGGIRMAAE